MPKAKKLLKLQLDEGQHYPDYARKLYLIENCIYGVDIQPIATQISKLRFFISLLCDQLRENWNAESENHGLLSLPNLEAKFVCANTLISLPKTEGELELMSCSKIPKLREKLQENRHRIFAARTFRQKEKLKARDLEIRDEIREAVRSTLAKPDKELIKVQEEVIAKLRKDRIPFETPKMVREQKAVQADFFAATQANLGFEMVDANKPKRAQIDAQIEFAQRKIDSELAKSSAANVTKIDQLASLVAGWDPYDQNASSSFFDPEWMFNIADGFDVVIGNPPYISHDQIPNNIPCKSFTCYEPFADIYCYFYERGVRLLSKSGIVSYITSNSFLRVNYGLPLRKFVHESCDIIAMIDIEGSQIFESAIVNTVIAALTTVRSNAEAKIVTTSWDSGDFNGFVQENCYRYCQADFIVQPWTLIRPECLRVREKMERAGKTLEQRETKIRLGLATGDNNAFVIDDEMRLRLVKQDSNNRKLIKPVIRGQDIQRYCHEAPKYILLTKNDVNVRRDYPTVYKYLDGFGERFKKRGAKGAHWTNLRACAFFDDF